MSSPEECICSIALTQIPGIGHIWAKKLLDGVGNAVDVFRYRKELPDPLPGVNSRVVEALDCPQALSRATQEFEFAEKNHISCLLSLTSDIPPVSVNVMMLLSHSFLKVRPI